MKTDNERLLEQIETYDPDSFLYDIDRGRKGMNEGFNNGMGRADEFLHGLQRSTNYLIGADSGIGKCLGAGTKVIMYDGTLRKVENVRTGELLMGPDGKPRTVLSTCSGIEQMYWVRQKRGIDYRVNESHILSLSYKPNDTWTTTIKPGQSDIKKNLRKREYTRIGSTPAIISNLSITEYFKEPNKLLYQGWKSPVGFGHVPVNEPYFVGLWLGDGSTSTTEVTTADPEIVSYLGWFAKQNKVNLRRKSPITYSLSGKCTGGKPNPVREQLRHLGIFNHKVVPRQVIQSNYQNRLFFIAGLIDSDGYYNPKSNMVEITQKRKELAEGIVLVLRSLGFYTTIKEKMATMRREDGSIYTCLCYRVSFSHSTQIPCLVPRKQAITDGLQKNLNTAIKVEKDTVDTYYGFNINGDKLFLLEDFTVTHNTTLADYMHILCPHFDAIKKAKKIHNEYFSWEIPGRRKKLRFATAFLNNVYKVRLPFHYILSKGKYRCSDEHWELCKKIEPRVESIFDTVKVHDVPLNSRQVIKILMDLAKKHGKFKTITTQDEHGEPYDLIIGYTNTSGVFLHAIFDHISLADEDPGSSLKQTIDRISKATVWFRNICGMSFTIIQQFGADMQSTDRRKLDKAEIAPMRTDFGDSKYTYRDADVVWGLVSPAMFGFSEFKGYDVTRLKKSYIQAFLMKNRDGFNGSYPLFMDPIAHTFTVLPKPELDLNGDLDNFYSVADQLRAEQDKTDFTDQKPKFK